MEKTNELNKFLSYIHMGTCVYRIYYDEAKRLENDTLLNKIVDILEIFKKHEENITNLITDFNEEATDSLTFAGMMGVYKERIKYFENSFSICINAIKATNMGYISALKFLHENKHLASGIKENVMSVIDDYHKIVGILEKYIFEEILK